MGRTDHAVIQRVILDAGPLIHLDEIECLGLLSDFPELLVPETVWREVECHRPSVFDQKNIHFMKVPVSLDEAAATTIFCNAINLDEGETSAIALCLLHPESLFLTDDAAARLAASSLGIRVHGTIGVLVRAIRREQLTASEVIKRLEEISVKSTLFIKQSFLKEVIDEIEKVFGD